MILILLDTAEQMAVFAEKNGRFTGLQTNLMYEVHNVETSQLQDTLGKWRHAALMRVSPNSVVCDHIWERGCGIFGGFTFQ